jgi:hypothetical protein
MRALSQDDGPPTSSATQFGLLDIGVPPKGAMVVLNQQPAPVEPGATTHRLALLHGLSPASPRGPREVRQAPVSVGDSELPTEGSYSSSRAGVCRRSSETPVRRPERAREARLRAATGSRAKAVARERPRRMMTRVSRRMDTSAPLAATWDLCMQAKPAASDGLESRTGRAQLDS